MVIFLFASLQSRCCNLCKYLPYTAKNFSTIMLSLNGKDTVTCERFGAQVSKVNFARHKKRCSVGKVIWNKWPNFSTRSPAGLNFHIAKKHRSSQTKTIHKCQFTKFSLVFVPCDYIHRNYTTRKVYWSPKIWMRQSWWERLTMRA